MRFQSILVAGWGAAGPRVGVFDNSQHVYNKSKRGNRMHRHLIRGILVSLWLAGPAFAEDQLKVACGDIGPLQDMVPEIGNRLGIFKKYGLAIEPLYTQGSAETLQAVLSGSVQIGIAAGSFGVLSAFAKGAPVRVIGATMTGVTDQFWYVRADSPIRSFKETEGKTIAFSTPGSSTQIAVVSLMELYGIKTAKPVATGGPAVTLTQVMTGQIDVGWSTAPYIDALEEGKVRIIARPGEVPRLRNQTVRMIVANADALAKNRDAIVRYMQAVREITAWIYDNPAGLEMLAEVSKISKPVTARVRAEFLPKEATDPDRIAGIDEIMPDAVKLKYIPALLTESQLKELIQVPLK
jgi:NitT/TauT family transport system substrate-binding protein